MFLILMKIIILIVPLLLSVAFLTLLESKMLGYSQMSKGPNVVGFYGIFQPLADGIKLFLKETMIPNNVSLFIYFFSPIIALTLSLFLWGIIPFGNYSSMSNIYISLVFILAISSISIYSILMSGWGSNSKYAFLGSMSAAAQMISYEVSLGLMIMMIMVLTSTFNLNEIINYQSISMFLFFPLFPLAFMFLMSMVAETNSAPFDLTEGESELVSGFNMEYPGMIFALFFLAEYSHIILNSVLFMILFFGNFMNIFFESLFIMAFFVWISTSYPSMSYDHLMGLMWKTYLPLSLLFIILFPIIYSLII